MTINKQQQVDGFGEIISILIIDYFFLLSCQTRERVEEEIHFSALSKNEKQINIQCFFFFFLKSYSYN